MESRGRVDTKRSRAPMRRGGTGRPDALTGAAGVAWTLARSEATALAVAAAFLVLASAGSAAAEDDLGLLVARLDTLHSSRDPLIAEIVARGDAVIPLAIDKLSSERRMTVLGASWVLAGLASDASLLPLLEAWSRTTGEAGRSRVVDALHMVLRQRAAVMRVPTPDPVSAEFEGLGRTVLCSRDALGGECLSGDATGPALLVYGEGIGPGYDFACGEADMQVLPSGAFRESSYLVGRGYVRLDLSIQDLPRGAARMPSWAARMGARPDALALVRVACGTVGPGHISNEYGLLWARAEGRWSYVTRLYHMSIN